MTQGVYVKGQGVVEFPDEIDKETILQALRRKFMSGAKSAVGAGEAALAVGSSAISEPVSGLAGLVGAAIPGEQGQGARYVQAVGDALSYEPSTDKGVEYMRSIANILQPVGDVIQGASQNLGDKAYSATGSPLAGAIGYSLPTAMLEGLGLKGLNIARKPVSGADLYSARMGGGAVDGLGFKQRMYHGTNAEFDQFDTMDRSADPSLSTNALGENIGVFFAENPSHAKSFGSRMIEAEITMRNPKVFKTQQDFREFMRENSGRSQDLRDAEGYIVEEGKFYNNMRKKLESDGFDGVVIQRPGYTKSKASDRPWAIAFDNSQISVIK